MFEPEFEQLLLCLRRDLSASNMGLERLLAETKFVAPRGSRL
jgi:hypothetical protein